MFVRTDCASVHESILLNEGAKVAKKRAARKRASASSQNSTSRELDNHEVEKQLDAAREALRNAEEFYARQQDNKADDQSPLESRTLGSVIDDTLRLVRRYPGTGVVASSAVGFVIGRITRRIF
ncbi:MAG: hypothetical protein CMJ70_10545 [Planctomycetaceae bacterium]|nr:hypothetical protein [Planctomycetaceae bacterium]HAA71073.1 hypothetical protein [Planctomycetaceae bacterium]